MALKGQETEDSFPEDCAGRPAGEVKQSRSSHPCYRASISEKTAAQISRRAPLTGAGGNCFRAKCRSNGSKQQKYDGPVQHVDVYVYFDHMLHHLHPMMP